MPDYFGTGFDDPRSAAIMALAGNMVRGDFGGGLLDASTAFQNATDSRIKRADALQQLQQRNIALQQATQEWEMRLPFMKALAAQFQGQGGAPVLAGSPAQSVPPGDSGGAAGAAPGGLSFAGPLMGGQPPPAPQIATPSPLPSGPAAAPAPRSTFMGIPSDVLAGTIGLEGFKGVGPLIGKFNEPTELMKTLRAAGIDPASQEGQRALRENLRKTNYIAPTRLGEGAYNDPDFGVQGLPTTAPPGYMNQRGPDGKWSTVPVNGGLAAISDSTTAKTLGKADATVTTQFNEDTGKYEPVTEGQQARNAWSGSPAAPAAFRGSSARAPMRTQQPLIGRLPDSQGNPFQNLPAAEPSTGTFVGDPAKAMEDIAGIADPQQRSNAYQALVQQLRTNGGSLPADPASAARAGSVVPKPSPGFEAGAADMAKAGAKRYNDTVTLAADSPTRVNVYDNILDLSKKGVGTGPGETWKNTVKGYVANTPVLSAVSKGWKDDVAGFQELNKFLYQNAQRNWQAAGGTGTDAQLEGFMRSNPNDKMFPAALQMMAEWGKAGELALQGKANAMQAWRQQGGNIAKQDQFEGTWRQNFDPVLFQLKTMDPGKAAAYVDNLKAKNPNAYSALMQKASTLKNMGAL